MSADDASSETTLLLDGQNDTGDEYVVRRGLLWRLYTSHFLSTWNMRSYEFAVILLFAKAYPDTLLPTSIRGVLTNGATLFLSPAIGNWVDRNAARFQTMQTTIVVQRACIVLGCLLWILLFATPLAGGDDGQRAPLILVRTKDVVVAALMALGIVERVCAVGNMLIMERDWVPTVASAVSRPPLHELNAVMRRIDLVSKILAPVAVSVLTIRFGPTALAAVTALVNLASVGVELVTARTAWHRCHALKLARDEPKAEPEETRRLVSGGDGAAEEEEQEEQELLDGADGADGAESGRSAARREHLELDGEDRRGHVQGLRLYFGNHVWLASMSAALQSFSVLSLSGPMTTYLLTRNYSLSIITLGRSAISVVEMASTVIFPFAANLLRQHPPPGWLLRDPMAALGLAGVTSQLALLVPTFVALLLVPADAPDPAAAFPGYTALIFAFLGLSRLGHWTHNMAVQQLVQTRVPPARRVEFSGVEMTFVSGAEIGRWAAAAVWSRPAQFKGVAAAGLGSVVLVWLLFVAWIITARRRGGVL